MFIVNDHISEITIMQNKYLVLSIRIGFVDYFYIKE